MGDHNHICTTFNSSFKWDHFALLHIFPGLIAFGGSIMRISLCVSVTGEMLYCNFNSRIMKSRNCHCNLFTSFFGISRKCSVTNYCIFWVSPNISNRSKINIKSIFLQIRAYFIPHLFRIFYFKGRTSFFCLKLFNPSNSCNPTTFFIRTMNQRHF